MNPAVDPTPPPTDLRRGILDLNKQEFEAWLREHGEPPMRARQVRRWLLQRGASSLAEMSDLPKSLRDALDTEFVPFAAHVVRHLRAADDTHKLLLRLRDGNLIECVLIQEDKRRTACISTQVGCGMACVFCASGIGGVVRNLSVGEIVEQLVLLRNLPSPNSPPRPSPTRREGVPARLTHIVVMGMGEPLANLEGLLDALQVATSKEGLGIGARHITISTVGLPAKIRRLADLGKQFHLAVSLHAPNDALRNQIVPTNVKTGLPAILEAAEYFFQKTGRQVTFEYVLLGDLNDRHEHAEELAQLLRGRQAHVNLIPFNDVPGLPYQRPADKALNDFVETLRAKGISVKVRKRKGSEIEAACGQLRRQEVKGE